MFWCCFKRFGVFLLVWNVSICRGKLQDLLEILTSKSGIMAEFSKYRFSRKEIDFQPNEVCSDLFHIKVYLTAEYERNRCFSCCHHQLSVLLYLPTQK